MECGFLWRSVWNSSDLESLNPGIAMVFEQVKTDYLGGFVRSSYLTMERSIIFILFHLQEKPKLSTR